MADSLAITLHASATETAGGSAAAVDLWGAEGVETRRVAEVRLVVSGISGTPPPTPALVVSIQSSPDGESWRTVDLLGPQTAPGEVEGATGDLGRFVRATWTLPVGAEATFALTAVALEAYCSLAELESLGVAGRAIGALPKADRIRHLAAASQVARGYLLKRHGAPLRRVGRDVAQAVAKIAGMSLLTDVQGVNPNSEATALALEEARAKERWLRDVARGIAVADVLDSTPLRHEGAGVAIGASVVAGGKSHGWADMEIV